MPPALDDTRDDDESDGRKRSRSSSTSSDTCTTSSDSCSSSDAEGSSLSSTFRFQKQSASFSSLTERQQPTVLHTTQSIPDTTHDSLTHSSSVSHSPQHQQQRQQLLSLYELQRDQIRRRIQGQTDRVKEVQRFQGALPDASDDPLLAELSYEHVRPLFRSAAAAAAASSSARSPAEVYKEDAKDDKMVVMPCLPDRIEKRRSLQRQVQAWVVRHHQRRQQLATELHRLSSFSSSNSFVLS